MRTFVIAVLVVGLLCGFGSPDLTRQAEAREVCTNTRGQDRGQNFFSIDRRGTTNDGAACIDLTPNRENDPGTFAVRWPRIDQPGAYIVAGKGWGGGSHRGTVNFNMGALDFGSRGYLSVYGWMWDSNCSNIREYYIVQSWAGARPTPGRAVKDVTIDGVDYTLRKNRVRNAPQACDGRSRDFTQYWAVRSSKVSTGTNHSVQAGNVLDAWQGNNFYLPSRRGYQILAVESFQGTSGGYANGTVWGG